MHTLGRLLGLIILVLVCPMRPAAADEPDARGWVRECMAALKSQDPLVRDSSRSALLALGSRAVVLIIENLDEAPAWGELRLLAEAMDENWVRALDESRAVWPQGSSDELNRVLEVGRRAESRNRSVLPRLDPRIAAVLRGVDPERSGSRLGAPVQALVALGRGIIPALGSTIRVCSDAQQRGRSLTAAMALADLVDPTDGPVVGRLIADGYGVASFALEVFDESTRAEWLATGIQAGHFTPEMALVARSLPGHPPLTAAVNQWLRERSKLEDPYNLVGYIETAGCVGDARTAELIRDAAGTLPKSLTNRWLVEAALLGLGDSSAMDRLVDEYRRRPDIRIRAAASIDRAFRDSIPASVWPLNDQGLRLMAGLRAESLSDWWSSVRPRARFDPVGRVWRVDGR